MERNDIFFLEFCPKIDSNFCVLFLYVYLEMKEFVRRFRNGRRGMKILRDITRYFLRVIF